MGDDLFPYIWMTVVFAIGLSAALSLWRAIRSGVLQHGFLEFERERDPMEFWGGILLIGIILVVSAYMLFSGAAFL